MFALEISTKIIHLFSGDRTPKNTRHLEYLHEQLVVERVDEYFILCNQIGRVLGPGFYAHDVLVDNVSGHLYLCETGFKFYCAPYCNRMMNVVDSRNILYNILDQETYAAYACSVFVTHCAEMGFL